MILRQPDGPPPAGASASQKGELAQGLRQVMVLYPLLVPGTFVAVAASVTSSGSILVADAASAPTHYDDGAENAPAGPPQLPNLLSGYRIRPPWKVAGVDYAVGVPRERTLRDPTMISMPGVSIDATHHLIRVTGNDITLDGYDFSLHGGWGVYIEPRASGTLIANSRFLVGANNVVPITAEAGAGSLTVQYCTLDGGGTTNNGNSNSIWALINDNGSGSFLAQYDLFQNAPADAIDFSVGTITPTVQYNLFQNLGTAPGSHPDVVQFVGDTVDNALEQFNTIYQPQGIAATGMQGIQVSAQLNSRITNTTVANNVIIASGPSLTMSYLIAIGRDATSTLEGAVVSGNYLDTAGAYGAFYPPSGAHLTFADNWNMATGSPLPSPPKAPEKTRQ